MFGVKKIEFQYFGGFQKINIFEYDDFVDKF